MKYKQHLLGHSFVLKTDKGLPIMTSASLKRWAGILSGFNNTIQHVKGSLNDADNLSRIPQYTQGKDTLECSFINFVENENQLILDYKDIAIETQRDPTLSKVTAAVQSGSLQHYSGEKYSAYRNFSKELSVERGCLLRGYRSVIPQKLRERVLNNLHISHFGMVKTKALAGNYVWWPGMDRQIEEMIRSCKSCQ